MNEKKFAELIGKSQRTLRNWRQKGFIKKDRHYFVIAQGYHRQTILYDFDAFVENPIIIH